MKYLFDTCVVSELVKKNPAPGVAAWVDECDEDLVFLSVLTIGEIQKGIAKIADRRRQTHIQHWLDNELRPRFEDRIIPVTEEIAVTWGLLSGSRELQGEPLPVIDGLLSATALARNLTIVTRNETDFKPTGARIFNPWTM